MPDSTTKHLWLPYTQMKTAPLPLMAAATMGSRIHLTNGRELIDGVASWWTACHGYNHPHIADAIKKQLEIMPHVMFGGMVHKAAMRLAERLSKLAPGDLNRVFFVDSGSVAVEVALKMAVQYWINKGEHGRTKFVSFRHGYHGDTMACMSLCDPEDGMHTHFKDYLPEQFVVDLNSGLEDLLRREQSGIAAVIIEPLVQGAGGMKFHAVAKLKQVADLCAKYNVLLIADEVFTGFGRTGSMFACEQAGIVPDIMCIGKALTGGTISLAATLARDHVFDAFWSDDPKAALMHGPTYMANPLACAAANASLDLFETEPRLQQVRAIESALREGLAPCRNLPGVIDVRVKGAIGVVQLQKISDVGKLRQKFIERSVWIRPFGDVVYLTPAFTIDEKDLKQLIQAVYDVIAAI